jgi:hypothetical protein
MAEVWRAAGGDQIDPRPDWLKLRDGWDGYMGAKTPQAKALSAARLGALIHAGATTDRLTAEFAVLTETLRRLVETQTRRDEKLGQFVPVDQVRALVHGMTTLIKRHVTDPTVIERIRLEFAELFHHRPPSVRPQLATRL